jgi:hypothetical protein
MKHMPKPAYQTADQIKQRIRQLDLLSMRLQFDARVCREVTKNVTQLRISADGR